MAQLAWGGALIDVLIVFVKAPRPGGVKTRLVAALGPERAAQLYRLLADEEIRRTAPLGNAYRRTFLFAPAEAGAEVAAWLPGEELAPQSEGDLGERMARAFADAFAGGARRVILIGTDTPCLSQAHVCRALSLLDEADLALGPAEDGGYYLIGLMRPRPELFAGIAWSTRSVLSATLERAEQLGLSVRLLEPLADVDTLEDVHANWAKLQPVLARSPELRDAVAAALHRIAPGV